MGCVFTVPLDSLADRRAIFVIPGARILQRAGLSPWLALLYFIPLVNLIFLWVFAFMHWPRDNASKA